MSGMLSKAIKSNILTGNTKYRNNQEKIGEVIAINEDAGTCTVNLVTRDGIGSVIYNVQITLSADGVIPYFPEKGDYVRLTEQNKRFSIAGKVDINTLNNSDLSLYMDIYADDTGGGSGYIGY